MMRLAYHVEMLPLTTAMDTLENAVNAYLIISGQDALLIDSGFIESASMIDRRLRESGLVLEGIYLTHFHPDHSLGALEIAANHQVKIHCHPLDYKPLIDLYRHYLPDADTSWVIADLDEGQTVSFSGEQLTILHIPGHSHGHIAIFDKKNGYLFAGDHVIPVGTVWIGPPDGHLTDYLRSLSRLLTLQVSKLYPGHGYPVLSPRFLMTQMQQRRLDREAEIMSHLSAKEHTAMSLVREIYVGKIPEPYLWAAKKTVIAHLQKLYGEHLITMRHDSITNQFYYTASPVNSRLVDEGSD